jgi:hypothetical protein
MPCLTQLSKGGFSAAVSDVDVIIVVSDDASRAKRLRLLADVVRLETVHELRPATMHRPGRLRARIERAVGHGFSCFVCSPMPPNTPWGVLKHLPTQLLLLLPPAHGYVRGRSRFFQPTRGRKPYAGGVAVAAPALPAVVRVCDPMPADARAAPPPDDAREPVPERRVTRCSKANAFWRTPLTSDGYG